MENAAVSTKRVSLLKDFSLSQLSVVEERQIYVFDVDIARSNDIVSHGEGDNTAWAPHGSRRPPEENSYLKMTNNLSNFFKSLKHIFKTKITFQKSTVHRPDLSQYSRFDFHNRVSFLRLRYLSVNILTEYQ